MDEPWDAVDELLLRALIAEEPVRADLARMSQGGLRSIDDLDRLVAEALKVHPDWRRGQSYANVVRIVSAETYDEMTGRECDPFYDDGRIMAFRSWIALRLPLGVPRD